MYKQVVFSNRNEYTHYTPEDTQTLLASKRPLYKYNHPEHTPIYQSTFHLHNVKYVVSDLI